jgi:hypothetical protein
MTVRTAAQAPVVCHYAADPARRPHCPLTAEVMVGPVALCPSCAAARSTLGKGTVPAALPPGPAVDVLDWLAAVAADAARADRSLAAAVTRARARRHTWAQIAGQLGVTRQAAQQRYGRPPAAQQGLT